MNACQRTRFQPCAASLVTIDTQEPLDHTNIPKCRIHDVTYPEIGLLRQGLRNREASRKGGGVKNRLNALFTVSKSVSNTKDCIILGYYGVFNITERFPYCK